MNQRQFDAAHDRYLNPPELCECCKEWHQYRNGLCFSCWVAGEDRRAEERHEREVIERQERGEADEQ